MGKKTLPIKTVYYKDELKDEFSGITRKPKLIDETYKYIPTNKLWIILSNIFYGIVLIAAFLYTKIKFGLKIQNRAILKPFKKTGYFLYGNHTQVPGDGFIQSLVSYPKKNYVIVNSDNVAVKGTEQLILMLGAMPLPTTIRGYKNFFSALEKRCQSGNTVVIYPEAHIWPYYTGIRNFPKTSFLYPVKFNKPVFSFTAVYKKRRLYKKPRIIVKIDGPFFSDDTLPPEEATQKLRDTVFDAMTARSKESNCEYIRYVQSVDLQVK